LLGKGTIITALLQPAVAAAHDACFFKIYTYIRIHMYIYVNIYMDGWMDGWMDRRISR